MLAGQAQTPYLLEQQPHPNPNCSSSPRSVSSPSPSPNSSLSPSSSPNPAPPPEPTPAPAPETAPAPGSRTSPSPGSRTSPSPSSRTTPSLNPNSSPGLRTRGFSHLSKLWVFSVLFDLILWNLGYFLTFSLKYSISQITMPKTMGFFISLSPGAAPFLWDLCMSQVPSHSGHAPQPRGRSSSEWEELQQYGWPRLPSQMVSTGGRP